MPIVRLTTTLKEVPEGLDARLAKFVNELFPWKELSHVFVMTSPGTKIYNNPRSPSGTEDMVLLEIQSMDTFSPDNVNTARESFIDFISKELGIAKSSVLVAFTHVPTDFAGLGS